LDVLEWRQGEEKPLHRESYTGAGWAFLIFQIRSRNVALNRRLALLDVTDGAKLVREFDAIEDFARPFDQFF
jgi:hypothetical protein